MAGEYTTLEQERVAQERAKYLEQAREYGASTTDNYAGQRQQFQQAEQGWVDATRDIYEAKKAGSYSGADQFLYKQGETFQDYLSRARAATGNIHGIEGRYALGATQQQKQTYLDAQDILAFERNKAQERVNAMAASGEYSNERLALEEKMNELKTAEIYEEELLKGGHTGVHLGYSTEAKAADLRQQQQAIRKQILEDDRRMMLGNLQSIEKRLGESLLQGAEATGRAIDRELSGLIGQYEDLAGISKQAIGAQQFASGLGRSGMTASRLAGAELTKMQSVAGARGQAETKKRSVAEGVRAARQAALDRRMEISTQLRDMEIGGLEDARYQQEIQDAKMQFQSFINSLEMSQQQKADMAAMMGGIATIGAMGAGYAMSDTGGGTTPKPTQPSARAGSYNTGTELV